MKNTKDLQNYLSETFEQLRLGKIDRKEAKSRSDYAGKILSENKKKLKEGSGPIEFFEEPDSGKRR